MIFSIALKEFYGNLVSARFILGFVLCLVLVPFSMLVSLKDYRSQLDSYEAERKEAESSLQVKVYSYLRPVVVQPPEPLSIYCRGLSGQTGNKVRILLGEKPMLAENKSAQRDNPLLGSFFSLDFESVLALALSLLALLFTYDAISGEREQGTLRLFLANPVSRAVFLLGKLLGLILTLLPVMLFCFLLSWLIIAFSPQVSFTSDLLLRSGLLLVAFMLFSLLMALVGLVISSLYRSSSAAIVLCLLIWVVTVFLVPVTAGYLARSLVRVQPLESLVMTLTDLWKECENKSQTYRNSLPQPVMNMNWNLNWGRVDNGAEMTGSPRDVMENYRRLFIYREPLRLEYAEKMWAHQQEYLDRLREQSRLAGWLTLLSPSAVLRRIGSGLCRTDAQEYDRFMERTRGYREELIAYFQSKNIFSSYQYFTPQPPETFMTADELIRTRSGGEVKDLKELSDLSASHRGDWSILFKVDIPGTNSSDYKNLTLTDLPSFTLPKSGLAVSVRPVLAELGLLAGASVLFFFFAFVSFARYDVR